MFKIGDKYVCLNSYPWEVGQGPKKDDILTINRTIHAYGGCYLVFEEWLEDGFYPTYFRKVEKKPFTNAITKELSVQVLTEEKKPQIERIEIKEKELV